MLAAMPSYIAMSRTCARRNIHDQLLRCLNSAAVGLMDSPLRKKWNGAKPVSLELLLGQLSMGISTGVMEGSVVVTEIQQRNQYMDSLSS